MENMKFFTFVFTTKALFYTDFEIEYIEATIYGIRKNKRIELGTKKWSYAKNRGAKSEVLEFLAKNGHLPDRAAHLSTEEYQEFNGAYSIHSDI